MQQVDYLPISSAHSMNAGKGVHAQKPYSFQIFAHESSRVGGRGKKIGIDTVKSTKDTARRLMERKAAQEKKTI